MRIILLFVIFSQVAFSQFAPPVGQPGTTAIYKDSAAFVAWANFCVVQRGLQDISNPGGPYATVGDSSKAIGKADNGVVSLGDGGVAICTFAQPIADGPGPDLAVFENSFDGTYLEFGFVEVSSDGVNFFRFPATSNTQDTLQTGSFGTSDATLVNNLAGKYRVLYGTPFDLAELQGTSGLNVSSITHVKIVDVVGSINAAYATYDKNNHKVNDPWPTAFASGGFDLDAVGIINQAPNAVTQNEFEKSISIYPNPAVRTVNVECGTQGETVDMKVTDIAGRIMIKSNLVENKKIQMDVSAWDTGVYFLQVSSGIHVCTKKILVGK
ncbi:MAG TPA: T9SS type A sorting domain-containing protein [Bacteroidia bacterium]|jgi:hypothetical protein|nr:T9SS type A sorting domain-containing protein [Bacteroidia bacterium]